MRDERPFSKPPKFAAAFRGIRVALREEGTFRVFVPITLVVAAAAWRLHVAWTEVALLALCIGCVWSAELFNSALERLARAIDREENPLLRDALDMAAGGVLLLAGAAAVVGVALLAAHVL